jgi:Tfp pilus assembly protein PilV
MLVALVCLGIALTLVASWLGIAALERQVTRERQYRLQADWLAESALERAAASLDADPSYLGETWQVAPQEFGGSSAGEVVIRVETPPERLHRRSVHVQADYPAGDSRRHRRSKAILIDLNAS